MMQHLRNEIERSSTAAATTMKPPFIYERTYSPLLRERIRDILG